MKKHPSIQPFCTPEVQKLIWITVSFETRFLKISINRGALELILFRMVINGDEILWPMDVNEEPLILPMGWGALMVLALGALSSKDMIYG